MGPANQRESIPKESLPYALEQSPIELRGEMDRLPTIKKARFVHRHFEAIARRYDFMNTLLSLGLHFRWKRAAIRALEPKKGERVLDVCGGTGDLSLLAAKRMARDGRVVLYDFNRAMLQVGLRKVARASAKNHITLVQGDAEWISLASNSFDRAVVGFGIRNLSDMERGFSEMLRILKPGGRLICLEFSIPPGRWFRWLYDFYSFHILPRLGKTFAGSKEAYIYLYESIRQFPSADELSRILQDLGFVDVTYRRFSLGIAVIHQGTKPRKTESNVFEDLSGIRTGAV
jgi:demethylmenaquinone methyltransferase/2-methoxy-6-polyprenyl-1,4-benzoquinol methylase